MSPDFDFWDREESAGGLISKDDENDVMIDDGPFETMSINGTFFVKDEGDKLIITIKSEKEFFTTIEMPSTVLDSILTMMNRMMDKQS